MQCAEHIQGKESSVFSGREINHKAGIEYLPTDCTIVQYSSIACTVYIARILASVRSLTSIGQAYTQRTLHFAIIHATRNVQTEGKFAVNG